MSKSEQVAFRCTKIQKKKIAFIKEILEKEKLDEFGEAEELSQTQVICACIDHFYEFKKNK